jgi:hypothetical protein
MKPKKAPKLVSPLALLSERVHMLSAEMLSVAVDMDYYGGFDGNMQAKARELLGASKIAKRWAKQIKREENW